MQINYGLPAYRTLVIYEVLLTSWELTSTVVWLPVRCFTVSMNAVLKQLCHRKLLSLGRYSSFADWDHSFCLYIICGKENKQMGKVIPVTDYFLENRLRVEVSLSALRFGRLSPVGWFLVFISVRGFWTLVRLEGLDQLKNIQWCYRACFLDACFLFYLFFNIENGIEKFFRNVGPFPTEYPDSSRKI
jgi:hypothetical protein